MHQRKKLIKDYSYLLWYVKEEAKEKISDDLLVETILNYGDWAGVQRLIKLLGIKKVSDIFFKQVKRSRCNYRKQAVHFFSLYFNEHVS
ncbi:MAG TPA: hypothetical protein VMT35_04640 [Ignavibacteriaceae bacterium]|nr:hypothetical protein [Ignavibacteriaceae bacterium]